MRNFLMITTAVYGLSVFAPAISQAQTCTAAPSCADMGYDKTAADCEGKKMLKCPFDLTAVSCEDGGDNLSIFDLAWEELEIIKRGDPRISTVNYCNGNYLTDCNHDDNTFTFHSDGCLFGDVKATQISYFYINGIRISYTIGYNYINQLPLCFSKGTKLGIGGQAIEQIIVVPTKSSMKPLAECEVGDFYYANDKCHSGVLANVKPIGVVIDAENKLVMACYDMDNCYGSSWMDISHIDTSLTNYTTVETAITDMNGKANSEIIYDLSQSYRISLCFNKNDGNKSWFVPAAGQLKNMINKYDLIANNLQKIISYLYIDGEYYFATSTEYDNQNMWVFDTTTKEFTYVDKYEKYPHTMCVFEY